jgi:hypothetical protein
MWGFALVLSYFALAAAAAAIVMQSDRYLVERSAIIDADARKIFGLVSDPRRWSDMGEATVVESKPNELVVMRVAKGEEESFLTFGLRGEGAETLVECVISGRNSLLDKARNLIAGREKTLGPKIEKALAELAASF